MASTVSNLNVNLVPLTPLELYLRLAAEPFDAVRAVNSNYEYYPVQFGGPVGQSVVANNGAVLLLSDFKVT